MSSNGDMPPSRGSGRRKLGSNRRTTMKKKEEANAPATEFLLENEKRPSKADFKIQNLKNEVGQVMNQMIKNVDDINKRGDNLDKLNERANDLLRSSQKFPTTADALLQKHRRKNRKV